MQQIKQIFKPFLIAGIVLGMVSCVSNRGAVNGWEDSALAARQRAEIEQLQRDIAGLQSQLGNAQQITRSSIESIDRAYARLESGLAGASSLQDSINELTEFARQCLAEINRLRSRQSEDIGFQPADRGEDAGTG
jgi:chromosome segregation ATPase